MYQKLSFRQHLGNTASFSRFYTAVPRKKSWHPVAQILLLSQGREYTFYCSYRPDYMPPEEMDNSSPQDHSFPSALHHLDVIIWQTTEYLHALRENNRNIGEHLSIETTSFRLVSGIIKDGASTYGCGRKGSFAPAVLLLLRHFHRVCRTLGIQVLITYSN